MKGKATRTVFEHELQRIFLIVLNDHFAGYDKVLCRLQKVNDSDRVTIDIALPSNPEPRVNLKPGRLHAYIVTLARPQVQGMRQQRYLLRVVVMCLMLDLDTAHICYCRAPARGRISSVSATLKSP
jgi:hypothetical protein